MGCRLVDRRLDGGLFVDGGGDLEFDFALDGGLGPDVSGERRTGGFRLGIRRLGGELPFGEQPGFVFPSVGPALILPELMGAVGDGFVGGVHGS
ncbi:MAG: hypothetical protein SGI90_00535 [Candidatus Eisenbacteria bacterium]|nr:hypothetical protein [Candidatus Eisenbacteria bacterium]